MPILLIAVMPWIRPVNAPTLFNSLIGWERFLESWWLNKYINTDHLNCRPHFQALIHGIGWLMFSDCHSHDPLSIDGHINFGFAQLYSCIFLQMYAVCPSFSAPILKGSFNRKIIRVIEAWKLNRQPSVSYHISFIFPPSVLPDIIIHIHLYDSSPQYIKCNFMGGRLISLKPDQMCKVAFSFI